MTGFQPVLDTTDWQDGLKTRAPLIRVLPRLFADDAVFERVLHARFDLKFGVVVDREKMVASEFSLADIYVKHRCIGAAENKTLLMHKFNVF